METLSLRVEPELKERIDKYADSIDETKSTAARNLLLIGLETNNDQTDQPRGNVTTGLLLLGTFMLAGTADLSGTIFSVDLGIVGLGLLLVAIINDQTSAFTDLYARFTESPESNDSTSTD